MAKIQSVSPQARDAMTRQAQTVVEAAGLWLEGVTFGRQGSQVAVRVIVDLPSGTGGVSSDQLADVTRELSKKLDEIDVIPDAYILEVSTPGAERKLTQPRHYSRSVGRLVSLRLTDGTSVSGHLENFAEPTIELKTAKGMRVLSLEDVASARVQVELNRAKEADFPEEA